MRCWAIAKDNLQKSSLLLAVLVVEMLFARSTGNSEASLNTTMFCAQPQMFPRDWRKKNIFQRNLT